MRASHTRKLASLEASYREQLLSALEKCANGRWGLFNHNEWALSTLSAAQRLRLDPDGTVQELLDLGSEIERLRSRFRLEGFPLHERLLQMRSSYDSNTLGEPKLAREWLDELIHTKMSGGEKQNS